jgi:hypothetical protein
MTEPYVIPCPAPELQGKPEPALETVAAPPILITEQEVAFSTAAAQAVQPRPSHWWTRATRLIALAPRRIVPTLTADSRRAPSYYARHYGFLEDARMAREMHRL